MIQRLLTFAFVLALVALPVIAQEDDATTDVEELPVIPYYTSLESGQQFNVPIPEGWRVVGPDDAYIRMVHDETDGEIYVIAVEGDDLEAAIVDGLARIDPAITVENRLSGRITIDGLAWAKDLYDIENGGDITVFAREQDGLVYVLAYINPNPDVEFFMFAAEGEDLDDNIPVEDAIADVFPDVTVSDPATTTEVRYADRTWTRSEYPLEDGETLYTLHQGRFSKTYLVAERGGDGTTLTTVNRAMFTVLFGFFVTPENASYLWLGLGATAFLMLVLIGSILIRHQNVQKDLRMIEQLQED